MPTPNNKTKKNKPMSQAAKYAAAKAAKNAANATARAANNAAKKAAANAKSPEAKAAAAAVAKRVAKIHAQVTKSKGSNFKLQAQEKFAQSSNANLASKMKGLKF